MFWSQNIAQRRSVQADCLRTGSFGCISVFCNVGWPSPAPKEPTRVATGEPAPRANPWIPAIRSVPPRRGGRKHGRGACAPVWGRFRFGGQSTGSVSPTIVGELHPWLLSSAPVERQGTDARNGDAPGSFQFILKRIATMNLPSGGTAFCRPSNLGTPAQHPSEGSWKSPPPADRRAWGPGTGRGPK
jgi:hypothetical protein